jgi:hypothetical protein
MSICDYNTKFKQAYSISEDYLLNIIEGNFKTYFDWAFLNIGAWFDVALDNQTIFGTTNHAKLLYVEDPSYDDGSVWQGIRKDWVWETGVIHNEISPINISGIYLNSGYLPNNNISNTYNIDYPNGKIIFQEPISPSSDVELNYSYRYVQVYRAIDSPWFTKLQYSSFNTDNKDIFRTEDGDWSIGSEHRVQLPAIIIESLARSRSRPYEIGSNSLLIEQDIAFHILAENKNDRNKLLDILRLQQDSVIWLYNTNSLAQDDNYPLNYMGNLKENALMYPNIIEQYRWRKCWIKNVNLFDNDSPHPNLYRGMVRATLEIISE